MEYFITLMLVISICGFYLAYKTNKRQKQQVKNKSQNAVRENKPYAPVYQPLNNKIYPEISYDVINIMTKKARKDYKYFSVIDFETTGLSSTYDKIIEIGAIKIQDGVITDSFNSLVNPRRAIPAAATNVNGITDSMVKNAPYIETVLPELIQFVGDDLLVAHNASFDMKFLLVNAYDQSIEIKNPVVDTLFLCRKLFPDFKNHKLGTVAAQLCIDMDSAHRALCDVETTANILIRCISILDKRDKAKDQERKLAKEAAKVVIKDNVKVL